VIEDMRLYEHGLKVVLRKIDNFLPTQARLSARRPRRPDPARDRPHIRRADAEALRRYSPRWRAVVAVLQQWLLRAPPNAGGGLATSSRC
jgi:hypothetical protein